MLRWAALLGLLFAAGCHSPRPSRPVPARGDEAPRPAVIQRRLPAPEPFTLAEYRPIDRPLAWTPADGLVIGHWERYSRYDVVGGGCGGTGFYLLRAGQRAARRMAVSRTACDALDFTPAVSADGSWAVFTAMGRPPDWRDRLARLELATGRVDTIPVDCEDLPGSAAISHDGTRIVVVGRCQGEREHALYEMRADGSGLRVVSPEPSGGPAWSPDDSLIAVTQHDHIVTIRPSGEDRRVLSRGVAPAWSPDGEWIAFVVPEEMRTAPYEIRIIRPDGSDERTVFRNEVRTTFPDLRLLEGQPHAPMVWSPDSRWIAFPRSFDRGTSVWRVEVATGHVQPLTRPDR